MFVLYEPLKFTIESNNTDGIDNIRQFPSLLATNKKDYIYTHEFPSFETFIIGSLFPNPMTSPTAPSYRTPSLATSTNFLHHHPLKRSATMTTS
jgi:hypothetical protein